MSPRTSRFRRKRLYGFPVAWAGDGGPGKCSLVFRASLGFGGKCTGKKLCRVMKPEVLWHGNSLCVWIISSSWNTLAALYFCERSFKNLQVLETFFSFSLWSQKICPGNGCSRKLTVSQDTHRWENSYWKLLYLSVMSDKFTKTF